MAIISAVVGDSFRFHPATPAKNRQGSATSVTCAAVQRNPLVSWREKTFVYLNVGSSPTTRTFISPKTHRPIGRASTSINESVPRHRNTSVSPPRARFLILLRTFVLSYLLTHLRLQTTKSTTHTPYPGTRASPQRLEDKEQSSFSIPDRFR